MTPTVPGEEKSLIGKQELDRFAGVKFRQSFIRWLGEAEKVANGELRYIVEKKYVRISIGKGGVYGFINQGGDVLKAASWARPAPHPRGSIFNTKEPADGAGEHGVMHMDELSK